MPSRNRPGSDTVAADSLKEVGISKSNGRNGHRAPRRGYPRPQLQRKEWIELNGQWDFAIDAEARWSSPDDVRFNRHIEVPFAPETPASGIEETGFFQACWYRRTFDAPKLPRGQRLILHFGAVDYEAEVWVNGRYAMRHEGGYTPFFADITDLLTKSGPQEIVVRAMDDPHDLAKPRGKQDWVERPHSIWYFRTTGIWQTVWLERVPATRINRLRWTFDFERWELGLEVHLAGQRRDDLRLRVRLRHRERLLADDNYSAPAPEISRKIALTDPGIDDYRNDILWSPQRPTLLPAEIELIDESGSVVDSVQSYTAMRHVATAGSRFTLNGAPIQLQLVLDQGYWPDGGLTAPGDEALRRDVELVKAMGFNGVRKHQKIEDPRYLYWADQTGIFVWEEMPSCYRFSVEGAQRLARQWAEAVLRDASHPCIVAWVPINESWGVPTLSQSLPQRHFLQGLYHLTKTLDPSRPVIGNDGWEVAETDIVAIHDYDAAPRRLAQRYDGKAAESVLRVLSQEQPAHRVLMLDGFSYTGQPVMLTEFGGIAYSRDVANTWGYSRVDAPEDLARQYYLLLDTVRSLPMFAGFCYTQFTDTYQEANGLLYMDRTPKFPLDQMSCATRGARGEADRELERQWRSPIGQERDEEAVNAE